MTKTLYTVPTYHPDCGHNDPTVPVAIGVDQGISIDLKPGGTDAPDIYIERREDGWYIGISPESQEVRAVIRVGDDRSLQIENANGGIVLREKEQP